jgi:hypothetical protein
MKQTLIFTALPHKRIVEDGSDKLKISATVSIRLDPGSPTTLADFEDILSWTQHIKAAQYKIRLATWTWMQFWIQTKSMISSGASLCTTRSKLKDTKRKI